MDWFREPLAHFLLIGALLFAVYAWTDTDREASPRVVRVTAAEVKWLEEGWTRQWSRPPDEQDLRGLVAGHVREKLLASEARELGLDQDDTVVRRRLAQKMEFLVADAASVADPSEGELLGLYQRNESEYRSPARLTFSQIFFRDETAARQGLVELRGGATDVIGHGSLLTPRYSKVDAKEVAAVFGPEFFDSLGSLDVGGWHGPIESAYGFHLVRVHDHEPSRLLPFEDVRDELTLEWRRARRADTEKLYLAELMDKYDVVVDAEVADLVPQGAGSQP